VPLPVVPPSDRGPESGMYCWQGHNYLYSQTRINDSSWSVSTGFVM
jgi:hypothetical protein